MSEEITFTDQNFKEEIKVVIPMDSKTTLLEGAKANVK